MVNYHIVICDGLHESGLRTLQGIPQVKLSTYDAIAKEDLISKAADADFVVIRSATKLSASVLQQLPRLKGVVRAGVGIDNVDVAKASELGIWVWNAPKGNFQSTAEMALALMFAAARNVAQTTESMRKGLFPKKEFGSRGRQLSGSTLGIFGAGNIGLRLARMARSLGMNVLICDPVFQAGSGFEKVNFDTLIAQSDFISIHAPLLDSTRHVFQKSSFEKMKRGCILVNCARGGIVKDADVVPALEAGHLSAVGLDVFEQEPLPEGDEVYQRLVSDRRVILSPHLGASTREAQAQVGAETAEKLSAVFRSLRENGYQAPKALNQVAQPRLALQLSDSV